MITTIHELRDRSTARALGATAKPSGGHPSCDVIARLEAPPDTQGGKLVLQATALFDGPHVKVNQTDTYVVREGRVRECLDNLNKGAGAGVGSILAFGNTWRDQETGTLSIGWINTAISAQKVKGELNHHQHRRVEQAFAQMPVLDFTNIKRTPGEPSRIRWPLGLNAIQARVQGEGGWRTATFERDWLKEKLREAWDARQQEGVSINLRLPVLYPTEAVPVRDLASAALGINRLLGEHPHRSILTRVSTSAGDAVETRWQPLMRGEDVVEWAGALLSQAPGYDDRGRPVADPVTGEQVFVDRFSLIQGIDNRLLFEAARQGQLQIEFLPRESLLVASKNAVGLANDIKTILQSETAADLRSVAFAFGDDPEAVARVALVLQQQDNRTYVVAGPFRLDAGPAYSPATVPSPHWPIPSGSTAAARATTPVEGDLPLEAAMTQDIPPLGEEEDFELDGAAIGAALDDRPLTTAAGAATATPADAAGSAATATSSRPESPLPEASPAIATSSRRAAPTIHDRPADSPPGPSAPPPAPVAPTARSRAPAPGL